jgi:PAS domain S-box-containing protein
MEFDSLLSQDLESRAQIDGSIDASLLLMADDTDQRRAQRRKADQELEKSEERYRAIVEHSSEAVWCVDIEPPCPINLSAADQIEHFYAHGFLAECNDVTAQMYGFSEAAEIVGLRTGSLLPRANPDNQAYLNAFIQSNYRLADAESQEFDKAGRTKFFLNNLVGIVQDEALVRAWGTQRDITERKKAENALRESEERYERLIELCPDAIIVHTDGLVTFCNSAAVKLIGDSSAASLLGRSVFDFVAPVSRDLLRSRIINILNGESLPAVEFECMRLDGSCVDVEMQSVAFTSGSRRAIQAVIRDISERKQAEQEQGRLQSERDEANERALRDYERLVERIAALGQTLGNARDLTTIFRALRDFTLVSAPCQGVVISLYNPEKEVRKPVYCWADNTEMDTKGFPEIPVRDGMAGRSIKTGTVIINNRYQVQIRATTTRVWFGEKCNDETTPRSALSAPMIVMGRTIGTVEIQSYRENAYEQEHVTAMRMAANLAATAVENVTLIEREQATEEQLRQSQKMDAIGQLAGGVAHDFNNLLTVITGYTDLGMRRMEPADPLRKNLEQIKKAGDRAASLTRQLLAFSRKQMFQEKVVDLNSIVADMDKMLQRLIGEDIDLVSLLEPSLSRIKADPGQIEQVLLNLAVNARDAMPRGGKLTIETGHANLDEAYVKSHLTAKTGRYVMLAVSDTGTGMDAETQKHVFEPFFTTKEVGKGTGLGLATVYGIVKQSSGDIWIYSEPGKGTTFKIYLPIAEDLADVGVVSNPIEVPQGQGTILLVEDEELVRNLAGEILRMKGYEVLTAANGIEALRICAEHAGQIDLMVTDVVMPHMGGRELAERVGLVRPETKVLYMSGYTDDAVVRHGILDEQVSFIQKPFSPDLFALKVREVLEHLALPDELHSSS